MVTMMA